MDPRLHAKRNLERAAPVDSKFWRIGVQPLAQQARGSVSVLHVLREMPRLAERDEPLMAVHFPRDLVVADLRIVEVRHPTPIRQWSHIP